MKNELDISALYCGITSRVQNWPFRQRISADSPLGVQYHFLHFWWEYITISSWHPSQKLIAFKRNHKLYRKSGFNIFKEITYYPWLHKISNFYEKTNHLYEIWIFYLFKIFYYALVGVKNHPSLMGAERTRANISLI